MQASTHPLNYQPLQNQRQTSKFERALASAPLMPRHVQTPYCLKSIGPSFRRFLAERPRRGEQRSEFTTGRVGLSHIHRQTVCRITRHPVGVPAHTSRRLQCSVPVKLSKGKSCLCTCMSGPTRSNSTTCAACAKRSQPPGEDCKKILPHTSRISG